MFRMQSNSCQVNVELLYEIMNCLTIPKKSGPSTRPIYKRLGSGVIIALGLGSVRDVIIALGFGQDI
uniref:Uncharacterized protein n=1 Tax=Rhizophagus irregularis (strain DAOM 181602 / DAOM 197198 / MUCL 43194) TaxID=747089 RepID=U9UYL9_RHIID